MLMCAKINKILLIWPAMASLSQETQKIHIWHPMTVAAFDTYKSFIH